MTKATPTRTNLLIPNEVKTEVLEKFASGEMTVAQAAEHIIMGPKTTKPRFRKEVRL